MNGTPLYHEYLDKLCGITTPTTLKTGKPHLYIKHNPTASDEADTNMVAAIIYQGEAQHALYVLDMLSKFENNREKQICSSTDTGLGIEIYALRYQPKNNIFHTTDCSSSEISEVMLADIRKTAQQAISHGVHGFRLIFKDSLELRSGEAGNFDFVSVTLTREMLKRLT